MADGFSILRLMVLALLAALKLQAFLLKRAVRQVIDRFRECQTLCSQGSKTVAELGLQPRPFFERLFKPRDYKPYALQLLIQRGVVRLTDGDKLCLVENKVHDILENLRLR